MESPQQLLDAAYKQLGYAEGDLLDAADSPAGFTAEDWINKGEWLALAKKVGAEKVFFVDNNPVIVFAAADLGKQRERFQQIWNMARPPLLFLACPGELAVYNLNCGPAREPEDWEATLGRRQLGMAEKMAEVAKKLQEYRREQIETGRLFEDERFGDDKRADKALIADLQVVRDELKKTGLKAKYAHSLIGRSIFIRYLEDRGVLEETYFKKIARGKPQWRKILNAPAPGSLVDPELGNRCYLKVLSDKDFTYALFEQLSKDFNGDMFPDVEKEKVKVEPLHLRKLQDFLYGNADGDQLFFFAYRFEVIPIELISSIYEEFYNTDKSNTGNNGTHYTPPALVDFLLGQVLTPECLDEKPRILDPACGSGIFLVESFRRIVRHKVLSQNGRRLRDIQLRKILREQISGIDINGEAIRIAAFSLYLAFLHYQRPPDILEQIRQGRKLPNLKYDKDAIRDPEQQYDIFLEANSFDVESKIEDDDVLSKFTQSCAHVVVGNPPWGSPGKKDSEEENREAMNIAIEWCHKQKPKLEIGGREWSQAFVHRANNLLHDGGCAALLVSSGVLFKGNKSSQVFRKQWLTRTSLKRVVNFEHVRDVFFGGSTRKAKAISPFVSVVFDNTPGGENNHFEYWSAKKTGWVSKNQVVALTIADLKRLSQINVLNNSMLWKIYWWGGHRDEALINTVRIRTRLEDMNIRNTSFTKNDFGRGFGITRSSPYKFRKCKELKDYQELPLEEFYSYGPMSNKLCEVLGRLDRTGNTSLYSGFRLLVKRSITQEGLKKGRFLARLAKEDFCFCDSIYGLKLPDTANWEAKILLGIFWSSLTRYYYWMTSGGWDMWHPKINLTEFKQMPIRLPKDKELRNRIVKIVKGLQEKGANTEKLDMFDDETLTSKQTESLEHDLDDAIFDLYELNETERDLVRDMCEHGLDLFYNNVKSKAVKPVEANRPGNNCGLIEDVPSRRDRQKGFEGYVRTFLRIWNRELEADSEFRWQLIRPGKTIPMAAIVFSTQYKDKPLGPIKGDDTAQWNKVLKRLDKSLVAPISKRVYIDGVVRAVSDTDIMIIKRNERRLWTRSMAREDAEATLLQAMNMQSKEGER